MYQKMTQRQKTGLLCMIVAIAAAYASIFLCVHDSWFIHKGILAVFITGVILIIGFGLCYKYWLLFLLPIWIFVSIPDSVQPCLNINNNTSSEYHVTWCSHETSRATNFFVPAKSTKSVRVSARFASSEIPFGNYIIYQKRGGSPKVQQMPDTSAKDKLTFTITEP